jgi:mono/diheme cytochrome c family protein
MLAKIGTFGGHTMELLRWVGGTGVALALAAAGWPTVLGASRQDTATVRGRQLFRTHCAACHGASGQGDGPMVQYLRVLPANLTTIAARNKGAFPAEAVHRTIDGRQTVRAHGDSTMPIWGDAFSPSQRTATDRIRDLVAYLESIQERPGD